MITSGFDRIHLVLFFTRGMSLAAWKNNGSFAREVALYQALSPQLAEVTFVTYGGVEDLKIGAELGEIRIVCNHRNLPEWLYQLYLTKILSRQFGRSTIVKSNQAPGGVLASLCARNGRARFIARCGYLYSFNVEKRCGVDSRVAVLARAEEGQMFPRAYASIVTTCRIKSMVLERYGVQESEVHVVPNYVETDVFQPDVSITRHPGRICYVGRLENEKNPLAIIDAVDGLDVELIFIGRGPLETKLRERATQLGVRLDIRGVVPNSDLPSILNSCGLFILASNYEGHPKALTEAMACGLAVVGTKVPGICDVIQHGKTGLLCGQSTHSLRASITRILENDELRLRLGKNARAHVLNNYALPIIVEKELAVYETVLAKKIADVGNFSWV